ncbi:Pre-rRNA-processing protein IPI1 [Scedosporium apiospermum]|uniref:Pre-rRNA-processing protein n=1 Tax=Pseudallescheria apiosperma TaxID=563466 RepID=A0A084FW55_PSEDA|nr:Pre-rRNA-processing protein IPI1 [Scedosporium apiospermum]KEZ39317.1 Pre-rRNA-processing protein IPI1 [Scedosporium apiospermum]
MGSSNKRKKEKQQDFKKTKLKVGKAKPKPSNFTDTSFKSKAIAVAQQSLSETAPDAVQKFKHNLSLAATSNSDRQRRDALSFLTSQLAAGASNNPVGTREVLVKLLPLVPNTSTPVRAQLLKLLRCLPAEEVRIHSEEALRWIRVGMTHLSAEVSLDSLSVLDWLLDVASDEAVSCPGGWVMTLNSFCAMMGWSTTGNKGWTSAPKIGVRTKDSASHAQQLTILAKFLAAGLKEEETVFIHQGQYWDRLYRLERSRDPFAYLNIYGKRRDGDGEMYQDRESRQRAFQKRYAALVLAGVDRAKREGGAPGRAAATLVQVLREGAGDTDVADAADVEDLLDLW